MNAMRMKNSSFRFRICLGALTAVLATAAVPALFAAKSAQSGQQIEKVLRDAVDQHKLPGVVAIVWRGDKMIYQGAVGKQDSARNIPLTMDSIFHIASMTKPVTSVAVMQLVESGRVKLDEPVSTYLPELSQLQVLEEFDATTGKAALRPAKTMPTVRQMLSHTSGFAYEFFDQKLQKYAATGAVPSTFKGDDGYLKAPLMFDPGSRWEYGISTDWLGKLVEKISGQSLEDYFHQHIFVPLGMTDTFFNVPAEKQARVAALYQRQSDGSVQQAPGNLSPPDVFSAGAGALSPPPTTT